MKLNRLDWAYIAGFLDGDGSIYVRLKPNSTYRFKFQIAPYVVFYQSSKQKEFLYDLKNLLKFGYVRERNDGVSEYIVGDMCSIKLLLLNVLPYLRLKKEQAELMLRILSVKENVKSAKGFLLLAEMIDQFRTMNYSKKRQCDSGLVKKVLRDQGLLTP
ncbi:MAG: LAGLIDADG family homing endonuclease [Patescibacteria group bacterium]